MKITFFLNIEVCKLRKIDSHEINKNILVTSFKFLKKIQKCPFLNEIFKENSIFFNNSFKNYSYLQDDFRQAIFGAFFCTVFF